MGMFKKTIKEKVKRDKEENIKKYKFNKERNKKIVSDAKYNAYEIL